MASEISYSDGKTIEAEIGAALNAAADTSSLSRVAQNRFGEWPFRYHLSPERGNLLRPFNFSGLDVVEFGCGLGAVSRGVAERCEFLYLIEGTQSRFDAAKARLRDLENWDGTVANFADAIPPRQFDVALSVGVLEYAELYLKPPPDFKGDAFAYGVSLMRRWLKPDGVLIIAIENRLGLKYWAGAGEDHTGFRFDGLSGYPEAASPKTFSRKELNQRLKNAELAVVDEYFPFPDYKMPHAVIRESLAEKFPESAASLASARPFEDYHHEKRTVLSEPLALRELTKAGLFGDFSNSFLFVATADENSATRLKLTEGHEDVMAWHYTVMRSRPTQTLFLSPGRVEKQEISESVNKSKYRTVRWFSLQEPLARDGFLRFSLLSLAFFGEKEKLLRLWKNFAQTTFTKFDNAKDAQRSLQGSAIDALISNALFDKQSATFSYFDQEWKALAPMNRSWWILRNALCLGTDAATLSGAGFSSLTDIYYEFCETLGIPAQLDHDLSQETALQTDVTGLDGLWVRKGIEEVLQRPFPKFDWREGAAKGPSIKQSAKELGTALKLRAEREMQKFASPFRPILAATRGPRDVDSNA